MVIVSYLIANENDTLSYRGYSTNLYRRLRQHRGIIKGGARYTKRFKRCKLMGYVAGFPSKNIALSYEWYTKKNRLKKYSHLFLDFNDKRLNKISRFCHPLCLDKFKPLKSYLVINVSDAYISLETAMKLQNHYRVSVNIIPKNEGEAL